MLWHAALELQSTAGVSRDTRACVSVSNFQKRTTTTKQHRTAATHFAFAIFGLRTVAVTAQIRIHLSFCFFESKLLVMVVGVCVFEWTCSHKIFLDGTPFERS